MSQAKRAVGYSQIYTTGPDAAAEQEAAIQRFAAEHGIEIVETFHDDAAGDNPEVCKFIARHCHNGKPLDMVAFDASRVGRTMPEVWRHVPCEMCGELKTIAAVDGELMAGCDLELC